MLRRQILGHGLCSVLALAAPRTYAGTGDGPAAGPVLEVIGGRAFGSYWRAVLPADRGTEIIDGDIREVIRLTDAVFSPYRSDSELTRLNGGRDTDWQPVSDVFHRVAQAAMQAAEATGGAFDPTVGPILARYGFGPIREGSSRLADVEISADPRCRLRGATLDFCGIAKGHALDLIAAAIAAHDVPGYLVELGGEVIAGGWHPAGRRWRVAVEAPGGEGAPPEILELANRAVATSGSQPLGYQVGNRRYSHIVDPRTAAPATGDLASVSVVAATAMEADAHATALFALGADAAAETAERLGLDALMLVRDGAGWRRLMTGRIADWLAA